MSTDPIPKIVFCHCVSVLVLVVTTLYGIHASRSRLKLKELNFKFNLEAVPRPTNLVKVLKHTTMSISGTTCSQVANTETETEASCLALVAAFDP